MIPEADKFAQGFIEKKIESILISELDEKNSPKYDILYSTAIFPDNGEDVISLMEFLKLSFNKNIKAEV